MNLDIVCSKTYRPSGERTASVVSTALPKTSYESRSQVAIIVIPTFVFSTMKTPKVAFLPLFRNIF